MPGNQKNTLIHQSALQWTSVKYPNVDVDTATLTQQGKTKEKTQGAKHRDLKILILEKFPSVDSWLL